MRVGAARARCGAVLALDYVTRREIAGLSASSSLSLLPGRAVCRRDPVGSLPCNAPPGSPGQALCKGKVLQSRSLLQRKSKSLRSFLIRQENNKGNHFTQRVLSLQKSCSPSAEVNEQNNGPGGAEQPQFSIRKWQSCARAELN